MLERRRPVSWRAGLIFGIAEMARSLCASSAIDRSELAEQGVTGVRRALERYDPALDTPFWAYAS
jgi:DNA-directed RNA polymerase specialized sigma subunit